jgi:hypothetical protein
MRVIPPITITDSNLTSSSVTEPSGTDPAVWSSGTHYVLGDQVSVLGTVHKVYECIVTSVTGGDSPDISVTRVIPKWMEVGATNKWAMFDLLRSTATTSDADIVITITPGKAVDAIAILNVHNVGAISVSAMHGATEVFNKTISLSKRNTLTWWEYFFGTLKNVTNAITFEIPTTYSDLVITVTIMGSSTRSVGAFVIGRSTYIGSLQRGASIDALNFSTIERDTWGNAILIPRRSVPKTNQKLYIDKVDLTTVRKIRDLLNAEPAVWSGLDDDYFNNYFNALLILGFYRTFSFELDNPIGPMVNIELEEI